MTEILENPTMNEEQQPGPNDVVDPAPNPEQPPDDPTEGTDQEQPDPYDFKKGEPDAHLHLTEAFHKLRDLVGNASGENALAVAERARDLALEVRDTANSAKELSTYTQSLVEQLREEIGSEIGGVDTETFAGIRERVSRLEDDVSLITFEMAMNGMMEGARNVFVDRITSSDAVIIESGLYGSEKAYI